MYVCTLNQILCPPTPQLVDHYGISKTLLPTRKLFGYFGTPKPQFLSDMQLKLDQLLKTVLQNYPVPPRALLEFCGYPFCVRDSDI